MFRGTSQSYCVISMTVFETLKIVCEILLGIYRSRALHMNVLRSHKMMWLHILDELKSHTLNS
jgi:hypothetical protein